MKERVMNREGSQMIKSSTRRGVNGCQGGKQGEMRQEKDDEGREKKEEGRKWR
jgi:hypothetical protein